MGAGGGVNLPRFTVWLAGGQRPLVITARDSIREIVTLCRESGDWAEHCWVHNSAGILLRAYHLINGQWELTA